jgi:hypothetical protein
MRVALVGAPEHWSIDDLPEGAQLVREGPGASVAITIAFCRAATDLDEVVHDVEPEVQGQGALWIAWPRRAAGHLSDLTDQIVRTRLLPTGLVDVKVAALGEDWSGLRFVRRVSLR